jgi:hypothetical protein
VFEHHFGGGHQGEADVRRAFVVEAGNPSAQGGAFLGCANGRQRDDRTQYPVKFDNPYPRIVCFHHVYEQLCGFQCGALRVRGSHGARCVDYQNRINALRRRYRGLDGHGHKKAGHNQQ